jgi:ribonuclease BN (tRNA processing enzyme)
VEFVRGADLLLHDAMLTDEEYDQYRGWGHSTFAQAVRLAEEAEVRRLALFHHAPDRGDAELQRIADRLRGELAARGSALELSVATEGEEIALPGRHG